MARLRTSASLLLLLLRGVAFLLLASLPASWQGGVPGAGVGIPGRGYYPGAGVGGLGVGGLGTGVGGAGFGGGVKPPKPGKWQLFPHCPPPPCDLWKR
ncbi:elastin-like [Heteronotia binoei]|uniref:elastin-like n=1 Tax=Heteronotia binoei TaxID=13085 RepID=UPI00292CF278|nr:elastin-like [Heteronotia binoei]